MYLKLTDKNINLATAFEKFQQEKYGNVLAPVPGLYGNDGPDEARIRMQETKIEIELLNPTQWQEPQSSF